MANSMSSSVEFHRGKEKVIRSLDAVDFPPLGLSPHRKIVNTAAL